MHPGGCPQWGRIGLPVSIGCPEGNISTYFLNTSEERKKQLPQTNGFILFYLNKKSKKITILFGGKKFMLTTGSGSGSGIWYRDPFSDIGPDPDP